MVQARGGVSYKYEPRLTELDQRNLVEIFKLEARKSNDKVDMKGLMRIFKTVGFEPNQKQISVFKEVLEANEGRINQH